MNALYLGTDKSRILDHAEPGALFIDDGGPLFDEFVRKFRPKIFDPRRDCFNPLSRIDYKAAREIAAAFYSLDPDAGKTTLTVRNGRRALAPLLLEATRLDRLARSDDPAVMEANATVDDALFSPLVRKALCRKPTFKFGKITIAARLNRAAIGDDDAILLGLLLVAQHRGQLIIPDFGFYGRFAHAALVRQARLIAGVTALEELPPRLRQLLLTMEEKHGRGCTAEDAEALASYAGLVRGTTAHMEFVGDTVGAPAPD